MQLNRFFVHTSLKPLRVYDVSEPFNEDAMVVARVDVMNLKTKEDKEAFAHLLTKGVYLVRFVKVDGSIRDMLCTRDSAIVGRYYTHDGGSNDDPFPEDRAAARAEKACAVFDVEKKEWRSFRWDSVIGFSLHSNMRVGD